MKTYSWDELDAWNVPEVDAIIHLAGKAHDTKNQSAAEVYFNVNTGLTQKIFDDFLAHDGIKNFVFFSTAKAAADKVEGVLTEEVKPCPVGPYGESKIAAENYIISKFQDSGFRFQVGSQSSKSEENLTENISNSSDTNTNLTINTNDVRREETRCLNRR